MFDKKSEIRGGINSPRNFFLAKLQFLYEGAVPAVLSQLADRGIVTLKKTGNTIEVQLSDWLHS